MMQYPRRFIWRRDASKNTSDYNVSDVSLSVRLIDQVCVVIAPTCQWPAVQVPMCSPWMCVYVRV